MPKHIFKGLIIAHTVAKIKKMSSTDGSPSPKRSRIASWKVVLNVGGTRFTTTKMTLVTNSTYFESHFSDEWMADNEREDEEIFIDQDPDIFRILLSFMRVGKIEAKDVTSAVLLQAQFLGINKLLLAARFAAEEEDILDERTMLYEAAKGAGLLDVPREIVMEYAAFYMFWPHQYKTDDEVVPYAASLIIKSIEEGGNSEVIRTSFLDALNFLSENGYEMVHPSLVEDLASLALPADPVDIMFSRLVAPEEAKSVEGVIIRKVSEKRVLHKKEFALFSFEKTTHDVSCRVASGPTRDVKQILSSVENGSLQDEELGTAQIREQEVDTGGGYFDALNWLKKEGFTTEYGRDHILGDAYRSILTNVKGRMSRPPTSDEIFAMVLSRPARSND